MTGDSALGSVFEAQIRDAIERARGSLLREQEDRGGFRSSLYAGPGFTGMLLCAEHYLGALDAREAAAAVRWLRRQQLADGSFPESPYCATGGLSATCLCYGGMAAAGVGKQDPVMVRAWARIEALGGLPAADPVTRIFLALAGLLPAAELQSMPTLPILIPRLGRFLGTFLSFMFVFFQDLIPALTQALKDDEGGRSLDPLWALSRRRVLAYLGDRQNAGGDWLGLLLPTLLAAVYLQACGIARADPRLVRAIASFRRWKAFPGEELYVVPFTSEVWDTALSVQALSASGLPWDDPLIHRGLSFLLREQCLSPTPPEFQNPKLGAPASGGWPYDAGNATGSDCDDTAMCLVSLLGGSGAPVDRRVKEATDRGFAWLLGMQNDDGGWPAYTRGHPAKAPGAMPVSKGGLKLDLGVIAESFFRPQLGFSDPSGEDVTARVLLALSAAGYTKDRPEAQRAVDFLKRQVDRNGAWWGRWSVNYLPTSAWVLFGLSAIGEDLGQPYVQRAIQWIKAHQNEDGGFGEGVDSYLKPERAGIGPSAPGQTGTVLSGLIQAGEGRSDTVTRGVKYLLSAQDPLGTWEDRACQGVLQPPEVFYENRLMATYAPLSALGRYLTAMASGSAP